jgi:hypothetical protein
MLKAIIRKFPIALAVSAALLQGNALAYESEHVFSIDDVIGSFDGATFGPAGTASDPSIICGLPGGTAACAEIVPYLDKSGVWLYPVDSEFGYYVVDFLGAVGKVRDDDYAEGFVGNEPGGGVRVSNAPTLKYKVKPPLGTWCQGLGGTSVKCETEHYTTMEHVLTCYETIPYTFANPVTGEQKVLTTPALPGVTPLTFDCANAPLDDNVRILQGGVPGPRLVNATPCDATNDPAGCQMFPNDKTDMLNNVGLSTDYSVQLKDDGKPLYGWGGLHKRPNDVRMYARLTLPAEWKLPGADYTVTRAELQIDHLITNNPNDQVRPEDLENEAATGRKPSYKVENAGTPNEVWKSTVDCYEGDGDFIEGETPATPIGTGTYLRNMPFALSKTATPGPAPEDDPYAFSADLYSAFTNAYYTTINRDPFEWSYVSQDAATSGVYNFVGTPLPKTQEQMDEEGLVLVSGPRWRLKPNKFGQDLPGLEIPLIECSAPPFKSDNIKYEVGERVTTVINLLDWDEVANGPSPLATSKGWVDVTANGSVTVAGTNNGVPFTTNGLPMTDDFDVAFYVKGDSKSTAIYSARLVLEYDDEGPTPPPTDVDLALASLAVPARAVIRSSVIVAVSVTNNGPADDAGGTVSVIGISNRGATIEFTDTFSGLAAGASSGFTWTWTTPSDPSTINWTATVTASDGDTDLSNNVATAITRVRR